MMRRNETSSIIGVSAFIGKTLSVCSDKALPFHRVVGIWRRWWYQMLSRNDGSRLIERLPVSSYKTLSIKFGIVVANLNATDGTLSAHMRWTRSFLIALAMCRDEAHSVHVVILVWMMHRMIGRKCHMWLQRLQSTIGTR